MVKSKYKNTYFFLKRKITFSHYSEKNSYEYQIGIFLLIGEFLSLGGLNFSPYKRIFVRGGVC